MIFGYLLVESGLINKIRNIETIAWMTIIFGVLLKFSDKFKLINQINDTFIYKSAIFIGIFQILALIPGVSRSGIAMTAARFLNFKRVDAAKISFLISIPILGAVSIFGLKNLIFLEDIYLLKLNVFSILLSYLFSFITIKFFISYIRKFNLNLFVFYRVILGIVLIYLAYYKKNVKISKITNTIKKKTMTDFCRDKLYKNFISILFNILRKIKQNGAPARI